ncbi:MAG: zf-HC2 domain-containing protein, partial [Clostridia bacterium]|nr:zf-HC2 domain-containing protein [Clostridia bacterium]
MKISCNIIEDLLPLYIDDVCSAASRKLVNDHLIECPKCLEKLKSMQDNMNVKADIRPLKNVGRWLERLRLKALIKGVVNGVLFMAIVIFGYFFLTEMTIMNVPADRVTVSDVCMLSDGNIAFHMYIDDKYDLNAIGADIDKEGNMYITPKRSIIENRRVKDFDMGLFNMYYGVDIHECILEDDYTNNPYLDFFYTLG